MTLEQWDEAFLCLCVWREVRNQTGEVIRAVACTIRNRVAKPGWWGRSWTEVIAKKWQYTSITGQGDPNLIVWPQETNSMDWGAWQCVCGICHEVFTGVGDDPSGGATHYYTGKAQPEWVKGATHTGDLGDVHFYIAS